MVPVFVFPFGGVRAEWEVWVVSLSGFDLVGGVVDGAAVVWWLRLFDVCWSGISNEITSFSSVVVF